MTCNRVNDPYFCPKFKVEIKAKIKAFNFNGFDVLVEFPNASDLPNYTFPFRKGRGKFEGVKMAGSIPASGAPAHINNENEN